MKNLEEINMTKTCPVCGNKIEGSSPFRIFSRGKDYEFYTQNCAGEFLRKLEELVPSEKYLTLNKFGELVKYSVDEPEIKKPRILNAIMCIS